MNPARGPQTVMTCSHCFAIIAVQSLLCNLCYASFAMQFLLCNLCYAIFAMFSCVFASKVIENITKHVFLQYFD